MKKSKKVITDDAVEILRHRYVQGDAKKLAALETIRADNAVARKVYDLRMSSGLTQRELAQRIGTSASAISRLEDADYEGHSLAMLTRIAKALNRRVDIRFVALSPRSKSPVSV